MLVEPKKAWLFSSYLSDQRILIMNRPTTLSLEHFKDYIQNVDDDHTYTMLDYEVINISIKDLDGPF